MSHDQFRNFLETQQYEIISDIGELISSLEMHNLRQTADTLDFNTLSHQAFSTFITSSKHNSPLKRITHNMTLPLK